MRKAVMDHLEEATMIIKAAAVADYHRANPPQQKVKKTAARLSLELDPTPDILAEAGRKKGDRLLVGFAAETENLIDEARRKLESKNCDMVVANLVSQPGIGFESDENEVTLVLRTGETIPVERASKSAIAHRIFDEMIKLRLALHSSHVDHDMTTDELRERLQFYRDLGVDEIYVRQAIASTPDVTASRLPVIPEGATLPSASAAIPSLAPEGDTLLKIRQDIGDDCRRCRLCEARSKIVFGSGNEQARLVFVGEGPGADEDAQGFPFVGRAGQLLTQMIENTASKEGIPIRRPDVYICNVVKCRPPENRTPQPDEMEICGTVSVPPADGDSSQGDLRAGFDRGQGAARHQGRRHQAARQVAQVARSSR